MGAQIQKQALEVTSRSEKRLGLDPVVITAIAEGVFPLIVRNVFVHPDGTALDAKAIKEKLLNNQDESTQTFDAEFKGLCREFTRGVSRGQSLVSPLQRTQLDVITSEVLRQFLNAEPSVVAELLTESAE